MPATTTKTTPAAKTAATETKAATSTPTTTTAPQSQATKTPATKKQPVGELRPARLAGLVRFPQAAGIYELALDPDGLRTALLPMVKTTLREPKDATFRIVGERVRVLRSKPGTTLDVQKAQNAVVAAVVF